MKFKRHAFVCVNERPPDNPKGCCTAKGAEAVLEALKRRAHEAGLKGEVRVNRAGCLDACDEGVSVVVYPEGVWYGGVTVDDVEELLGHLSDGLIVDRLRRH